jgi:site-specific recombinase XerD
MNNLYSESLAKLREELRRRNYRPSTIRAYTSGSKMLFEFFPDRDIRDLKKKDFADFLEYLTERRGLAASTIHQTMMALRFFYSKVFKSSIQIRSISLPSRRKKLPPLLEPKEVIDILNAIENIKHRTLIMLIYSSGLRVSEAVRLRIGDIDTKNRTVRIYDRRGKLLRKTVLSEESNRELQNYIGTYKPDVWLFSGFTQGTPLRVRSAQSIFVAAVKRAGITKDVSIRDLRHAFAGHLIQTGSDLGAVQRALGLKSYASAQFYQSLTAGKALDIRSPIDTFLSGQNKVVTQTQDLEALILKIKNPDERDYLKESLLCFKTGALRAGVVFAWTAAILNIHGRCLTKRDEINQYLQRINPKARTIKSAEDFAYFKDKTILLASEEIRIFTKAKREILEQGLDLRNKCGHPSGYYPKPNRVSGYLEELIDIVFT